VSTPSLANLFEESCDPQIYIPRRASEDVLRCLAALVRDGEPVIVLHGPAGIGKSMLLRVQGERFESERRCAYVSITDSPEPELSHRILDLLSEPSAEDPAQALIRAAAAAADGQPRLLLLIDHANLAPIESSLQLARAARTAAPHLSVIFAVADEDGAEEFAETLSAEAPVTTLSFNEPMNPQEATAYVRLRLARTQIPAELRARLDSRAMRWLSEGARAALPRDINRRAAELLKNYEENGEAALNFTLEAEETAPSGPEPHEEHEGPRAISPSEIPRDAPIDPQPPTFPMTPGDPASLGSASAGNAVSLGGSLLGHGPGTTPSFEIDLELGRSLSSGLLDSAAAKPSQRDGGPVEPPAGDLAAGSEAGGREAQAAAPSNRRGLAIAAVIALAIGVGYAAGLLSPEGVEPEDEIGMTLQGETPGAADSATPERLIDPTANPGSSSAESSRRPSLVDGPMLDASLRALGSEVESETPAIEKDVVVVTETSVPASMTPEPEPEPMPTPPVTPKKSVAPAPIVLSAKNESAESSQSASFVLLSIDVEPGSRVEVDGQSIGVAPFSAIFIEMGTHTFVAETPDGIRIQQMIDVQIGTGVIEF